MEEMDLSFAFPCLDFVLMNGSSVASLVTREA